MDQHTVKQEALGVGTEAHNEGVDAREPGSAVAPCVMAPAGASGKPGELLFNIPQEARPAPQMMQPPGAMPAPTHTPGSMPPPHHVPLSTLASTSLLAGAGMGLVGGALQMLPTNPLLFQPLQVHAMMQPLSQAALAGPIAVSASGPAISAYAPSQQQDGGGMQMVAGAMADMAAMARGQMQMGTGIMPTMPAGTMGAEGGKGAVDGSEMPMLAQGDQSFVCNICRKNFKREMNLIFHMTTHRQRQTVEGVGELQNSNAPVKCTDCTKVFATKYQAKKHFLRRHFQGDRCIQPYKCCKCDKKSFTVKEDLTMHMKACGQIFTCSCGIRLCSLGALKRHAKYFKHEPSNWEGFVAQHNGEYAMRSEEGGLFAGGPDGGNDGGKGMDDDDDSEEDGALPGHGGGGEGGMLFGGGEGARVGRGGMVEVDPADGQAAQLLLMADQHARRSGHYGGLEQQHGGAGLGLEAAGLQRMWQQQGAQALGGLSGLVGQMSPADAQQMRQQMQQQMHNQYFISFSIMMQQNQQLQNALMGRHPQMHYNNAALQHAIQQQGISYGLSPGLLLSTAQGHPTHSARMVPPTQLSATAAVAATVAAHAVDVVAAQPSMSMNEA
ncbi:hypothetical protein T492DRAFT_831760 [Pavlovales sp. CCMP2436]|nr:hypothetical protein T492DRAFT_831760 [Pavlovales sp. CCMP2436]